MPDEQTTVAQLRQKVADFVAQREWQRYHDAKNLAMSIAIEAAELMEHFQWLRNDELADLLADERVRSEVVDELADVACYVFALSNALKVDLSTAVIEKLKKNARKYPADEFRGNYYKPRD